MTPPERAADMVVGRYNPNLCAPMHITIPLGVPGNYPKQQIVIGTHSAGSGGCAQ